MNVHLKYRSAIATYAILKPAYTPDLRGCIHRLPESRYERVTRAAAPSFWIHNRSGALPGFSIREKSHVATIGVIRHYRRLQTHTKNTSRIHQRVYTPIIPHESHSIYGTIFGEVVHDRVKFPRDVYFDIVCDP